MCLQSTLLIATAVQFLALIVKTTLTSTTWVSLALAVLLAITIIVGQAKRVKQPPLDADALVRKLAEYRALNPKPPKGKKGGDGQPAPDAPHETSRQRGEEVPSDEAPSDGDEESENSL